MLKTLSLVLTDESRDAPALRAAAALARREDAHLGVTALGVEPWALEAMPMASAQIVVESGRAEAQARAEALALWARAELPSDLRASIEPLTVIGLGLAAAVAQRARFSDLCVAPRPYGANRDPLGPAVAEALLFGTGAPVLFVPDRDLDWSRPFRRIALAWNDGDEALAAARAALPFLRRADRVDIAIIDPPPMRRTARTRAGTCRSGSHARASGPRSRCSPAASPASGTSSCASRRTAGPRLWSWAPTATPACARPFWAGPPATCCARCRCPSSWPTDAGGPHVADAVRRSGRHPCRRRFPP
jgi:hypothetical protein